MKAFSAAEPKVVPVIIFPDNLTQRYRDGATHNDPNKENRKRRGTSISNLKDGAQLIESDRVEQDEDIMKYLVTLDCITCFILLILLNSFDSELPA